jgi:hypothetical protein
MSIICPLLGIFPERYIVKKLSIVAFGFVSAFIIGKLDIRLMFLYCSDAL